eukprot:221836_1
MATINPTCNRPLCGIRVKVIRASDITDRSGNVKMNADIASRNTKNKIFESKQKIKDFQYRTNQRIESIQSEQTKHYQIRRRKLKQNLKSLLAQSHQNDQQFMKTFSNVLSPKTLKKSKLQRQ